MTGRPVNKENRRNRQEAFLTAYAETGILKQAAERSGVPVQQHYGWMREDQAYAQGFTGIRPPEGERKAHSRGYRIQGPRAEKRAVSQQKFLATLRETGVIADAVKVSGSSLGAYHAWMKDDEVFCAQAEQILAETAAMRSATMSNRWSAAAKKTWADPERRAAQAERQRNLWTPEMRESASERAAELARDPDVRAKRSAASQARWEKPESRQQNRERMKQLWEEPEFREKVRRGSSTPESRRRRSEAAKAQWARMSPEERRLSTSHMRRAFKGGHMLTSIEAAAAKALNERGVFYQLHVVINGYAADLLTSGNVVIECDGKWFHEPGNERDAKRDANLTALGYKVLRLSEAEITAGDFSRLDHIISGG